MHPGMVVVPAADWQAVQQRLAALEGVQPRLSTIEAQQSRMLIMVENFALNTRNAFQAVEVSRILAPCGLAALVRGRPLLPGMPLDLRGRS